MHRETLKGLGFIVGLLVLSFTLVFFGKPPKRLEKQEPKFILQKANFSEKDPRSCGEGEAAWTVWLPALSYQKYDSEKVEAINDTTILNFQQFQFFAEEHEIVVQNFHCTEYMTSEKTEVGFSFCTGKTIPEDKLREILRQALGY